MTGRSKGSLTVCHERGGRARVNAGRHTGNQAPLREGCEDDKRVSVEKDSMVYVAIDSTDIQDLQKRR